MTCLTLQHVSLFAMCTFQVNDILKTALCLLHQPQDLGACAVYVAAVQLSMTQVTMRRLDLTVQSRDIIEDILALYQLRPGEVSKDTFLDHTHSSSN